MSATDLLAEITRSFQDVPRPDDLAIVKNNAPDYDLESIRIREALKGHTWQALPNDVMLDEQDGYIFLTKQALPYYLPAYLGFTIRGYTEADTIPDGLTFVMTLKVEVDVLLSAAHTKLMNPNEPMPKEDYASYQKRAKNLDGQVHNFIDRWSPFNPAQNRTILHFLEYIRDEHGKDYWDNEPQVAIDRYWFQFA